VGKTDRGSTPFIMAIVIILVITKARTEQMKLTKMKQTALHCNSVQFSLLLSLCTRL